MKANEAKENPKIAQQAQEDAEFQVGQKKSTFATPPPVGPDTAQLRQLQAAANASPQVSQLRALQAAASNSPQVQQSAQLMQAVGQSTAPVQRKENKTGMPDQLKSGIESLSGMSMDDVKVHHNSSKPASMDALAYAQGNDIHLGAGQEKHLAHEAWHVVQQRQGRVKPTTEAGGQAVNDDAGLENEADVMGAKALQAKADPTQQLAKAPAYTGSAQRVAQLWQEGRGVKNKFNQRLAFEELVQLTAQDIGSAMERVERLNGGTLDRYKQEYNAYINAQGKSFQWPLTYLKGRSARKNGRVAENGAINRVHPTLQKNNQTYHVVFNAGTNREHVVSTIPDFISDEVIGDVKNVKSQSFTEQMRAIYAMSKGFDHNGEEIDVYDNSNREIEIDGPRDFDLIVRSSSHPEGQTELTGPLESAADNIWYDIDK